VIAISLSGSAAAPKRGIIHVVLVVVCKKEGIDACWTEKRKKERKNGRECEDTGSTRMGTR
jgi:hypothetical protein